MIRITQQKIDGLNKRIGERIIEAKQVIETVTTNKKEDSECELTTIKLKLEIATEKMKAMKNEIEEKELDITTDNCDEMENDAEEVIIEMEQLLKKIERERENERESKRKSEQEIERNREQEEKEKQHNITMEQIKLERMKIEIEAKKHTEKVQVEIKQKEMEIEKSKVATAKTTTKNCTIRLPKLELKKFTGEKLKWQEFWDTFDATIHTNNSLQPIDKFNYLRAELEDEAFKAIAGLELTSTNYEAAIAILKERYGNKQLILDTHYVQLMEMQPATNKIISLRATYDVIEQHLRSLQALGEDTNQRQIISLIRTKLPKMVIALLEQHKSNDNEWTVESFRKALKTYITAQEVAENQSMIVEKQYEKHTPRMQDYRNRASASLEHNKSFGTTDAMFATEKRRQPTCIFCERSHWSDECRTVATLSLRKEKLKGKCYICLKPRHHGQSCKIEKRCYHCKRNDHHRSLCPNLFDINSKSNALTVNATTYKAKPKEFESTAMLSSGEQVVMQTAMVEAMNKEETSSEVTRILMDTGSSRTYITKDIADKLKLRTENKDILTVYTFGVGKPKEIVSPSVELILKSKEGNTFSIKANVVPQISGKIQRMPVKLNNQFAIQRKFNLADTLPKTVESSSIGLLIGNDYYHEIMTSGKEEIQDGLYLIKSKFGWILSGKIKDERKYQDNSMFVMTNSSSNILPQIHQFNQTEEFEHFSIPLNIEDFWKLETIGITPPHKNEDDGVMEYFNSTAKKENGRYEVTWPWRNEEQQLPTNYELSMGRLKSLHKRIKENPDILRKYDTIIKDQLEKGIIEKVNEESEQGERKHYIPHHAVFTPDKETTKVRIVYDASAKTMKNNVSLNECLHRGPIILEDVCGLLMRFRMYKIGMIADIEKAFLQVGLQPKERDVTRFLWIEDLTREPSPENIVTYRFTRVPWGVISSPFLLGASIKNHFKSNKETELQVCKDMYVDNLITGANSEDEALQKYKMYKEKFGEISMNMRDWKSNSKDLNQQFKDDELKGVITKVLGLYWNTESDNLSISTEKFDKIELASTKRQVLTTIASLFDPLGYLAPITMRLRLFLQKLWKQEKDWDDCLSDEDIDTWSKLMEESKGLSNIKIPRYIGSTNAQLIGFCDASKDSYAAAIYLKIKEEDDAKVRLLFAKSRIAPNKTISIPRLELMALLIGVRSMNFVAKELNLQNTQKIVWTDSQCVLNWLKSEKPLSVFVRNRLEEINKDSTYEFRYINTKENPADIPSRGMSSNDLTYSTLWWNGPQWLESDTTLWPTWNVPAVNKEILEKIQSETKGPSTLYETAAVANDSKQADTETSPFGIIVEIYSSFFKILRITAYATRFIQKLRKQSQNQGIPTSEEMETSTTLWIKYLQNKHYIDVTSKMLKKQVTDNQLNPKLDSDGIVRCYGRFNNAEWDPGTITPVLLPREERLVQLMIEDYHKKLFHAGVNHTLSQIRIQYWIEKGRAEVKKVLRKCKICRKYQGGPFKMPQMSPWPKEKLTRSLPFQHTGLDYFGPLYIKKSNGEKQKVWVCLFTCVVVRAIHLEIVDDLTAEQFLMALRRFIARRGKPVKIISDNAGQFKLAKSTLELAWENVVKSPEVESYVSEIGIKWSFIIELSPWMGGFYERLVGSSKMALKKSIGKRCLTSLQLQTFLTETEAVLNSRPLVVMGDNLEDGYPITPTHFLSPNTKAGTPKLESEEEIKDPNFEAHTPTSKEVLLNTWKRSQRLLESFWKSWKDDYLFSLRERSRRTLKGPRIESSESPTIGTVVQVKEDLPRGSWKIGKIVELIKSNDGLVRAARVLLPTKTVINRSLKLLYPLECETEEIGETIKDNHNQLTKNDNATEVQSNSETTSNKPKVKRTAAKEARDKILGQSILDE